MQFSAQQLSQLLDGQIEGNPDVLVHGFAKIEEGQEGMLSFIANPKYIPFAYTTKASILIVNKNLKLHQAIQPTLIRVADAYSSFARLLEWYQQLAQQATGIEQPSFIHTTAQLNASIYIGAFAYVGENVRLAQGVQIHPQAYIGKNVQIGEQTIIHAGVKIYADCQIGSHCIIHAGSVIGSDGFGFAPQADGSFRKIPQIGNVCIGDRVEIGANTTIDRATIGSTRIEKGAKLDNLVQIAHNVIIGENTVIAAQTGISGSTKLGKNCMIGGQVGFIGHIKVAEGSKINAQSGIAANITQANKAWMGSPATEYRQHLRTQVVLKKLPDLAKRVRKLEQKASDTK